MADSRDLPMGPHDMARMSSPEFAAAFARYQQAEQALRKRLAPPE